MAEQADVKDDIDVSPETAEETGADPFEALEADDSSWDEADDDEPTEETTAETDEPEEESDEQETEPEVEAEEAEAGEESEAEEDTDSEPEPEVDEESQKQLAHEAFKRREAERKLREAQQQREEENLQRYLDEAKDDEDLLRERQAEVKEHYLTKRNSEILERSLEVDIKLAVADLGLKNMDDATKNFVARRLDEFEATRVIRDKSGNLLDVKGDVYQYLKEEMDSISQFKGIGAREQTKKKTVEKAMTIPKASRTPKEPKKDDDLEDFNKEFFGE